MESDSNRRKVFILITGVVIIIFSYLLFTSYTFKDNLTYLTYNFDFYNMQIYTRVILFSILLGLLFSLAVYMIFEILKTKKIKPKINNGRYLTKEEYRKQGIITTRRELNKLFNSQEYKKAQLEKGNDEAEWNWQRAERLKREKEYAEGNRNNAIEEEDEIME